VLHYEPEILRWHGDPRTGSSQTRLERKQRTLFEFRILRYIAEIRATTATAQ